MIQNHHANGESLSAKSEHTVYSALPQIRSPLNVTVAVTDHLLFESVTSSASFSEIRFLEGGKSLVKTAGYQYMDR